MFLLALGVIAAATLSLAAQRLGALSRDGALAATIVGALTFVAGGIRWSALLVAFFLSSSVLSHLPAATPDDIGTKSARRDATQVLANGGVAAVCALFAIFNHANLWATPFAAAVAGATADTWATEIGRRVSSRPRLITTGRAVPPGTSGAVSGMGSLAATFGALFVAATTGLALPSVAPLTVAVAGVAGSFVDSVLGATVQEVRRCPHCGSATEQRVHRMCGTRTDIIRGVPGVQNDAVNALATAAAAIIAVAISSF